MACKAATTGACDHLRQILDLTLQALDPRLGVRNSMNVILEHHLLGDMVESHRREPTAVSLGPPLFAGVNTPMPEEETLQMLPRLAEYPHRRRARPDQVAHRLMGGIGNPHRRQFAGAMQLASMTHRDGPF